MIDPKLFMKIDITEPLRLSPKAFISKYDEEYFLIGIYDKDNARKFLKHLITAVYSFWDFISPEELIPVWPEETINNLFEVIITLKREKILVNKKDYQDDINSLTPEKSNEEANFKNNKHWILPHIKSFEHIPPNAYILNQGTKGAGYLALSLAKRKTSKVIATSDNLAANLYGQKLAAEQGLKNIDFVFCKPTDLSPICFANKFNVYLSELFCPGIFEEKVLESAIYAKEHLLSEDCQFIPAKINLKAFAYESLVHRDMVQESKEFEILYGLKFNSFTKALSKHLMGVFTRLDPETTTKLSEDLTIKSFDLKTLDNPYFEQEFEININTPGKITGICTYFELILADDIKLTNSPFDEEIQYMQRIFTPADSIYLEPGEKIKLKALYDNNFRIFMN